MPKRFISLLCSVRKDSLAQRSSNVFLFFFGIYFVLLGGFDIKMGRARCGAADVKRKDMTVTHNSTTMVGGDCCSAVKCVTLTQRASLSSG